MQTSLVKRRLSIVILIGLLLTLLLAACGNNEPTTSTGSSTSTSPSPTATQSTSTATTEQALLPLMTLVGTPTAKLVAGHHTFEVDGKIKNGDTKQHDIYVQGLLLDASGTVVGSTAFFNVDNVPGGGTASFSIQGTTMQPTWTTVEVKVVGVTENIGSSGDN